MARRDYDSLFKLVLIGDSGVGKSCLLLRFAVRQAGERARGADACREGLSGEGAPAVASTAEGGSRCSPGRHRSALLALQSWREG